MQKITANRYDKAVKEVQTLNPDLVNKLPKEINDSDKGHFVVALIKKTHNPSIQEYEYDLHVQQYDRVSFEKLTKGIQFLGYVAGIVLHSPTVNEEAKSAIDAVKNASDATPQKTEAELREEIKKSMEEDYNRRFIFATKPQTVDVSALTEEQVKEFASLHEIDIKGTKTNEEAKIIIREWQINTIAPKDVDLSSLKFHELKTFAEFNKVDLKGAKKTEEILQALTQWQTELK